MARAVELDEQEEEEDRRRSRVSVRFDHLRLYNDNII
jgi:hypothetical protein